MSDCNCNLRTKLVGDGCEVCNPEYADDHKSELNTLREQLSKCEADRSEAYTLVTELRERVRKLEAESNGWQDSQSETIDWWSKEVNNLESKLSRYKQALQYMANHECTMPEPCIISAGRDNICFACYAKLVLKEDV